MTATGGDDPTVRPLSSYKSYKGEHEVVDHVAAQLGLSPEVADLAKQMLDNGVTCMRCGVLIQGENLNYVFSFIADSPCMANPSPPHIVCSDCGYRVADFMGVQSVRGKVDAMGPDPVPPRR